MEISPRWRFPQMEIPSDGDPPQMEIPLRLRFPQMEISFVSVDGGWGEWKEWGECSKTCGRGVRRRTRPCDSPSPLHGGRKCPGGSTEKESCKRMTCPGMSMGRQSIFPRWEIPSFQTYDGRSHRSKPMTGDPAVINL